MQRGGLGQLGRAVCLLPTACMHAYMLAACLPACLHLSRQPKPRSTSWPKGGRGPPPTSPPSHFITRSPIELLMHACYAIHCVVLCWLKTGSSCWGCLPSRHHPQPEVRVGPGRGPMCGDAYRGTATPPPHHAASLWQPAAPQPLPLAPACLPIGNPSACRLPRTLGAPVCGPTPPHLTVHPGSV